MFLLRSRACARSYGELRMSVDRHNATVEGEEGQYDMKYVYLLQSIAAPSKHYVGITSNFQERLRQHNAGQSPHTAKNRPWKPVMVIHFEDDGKAEAFERYLKFGSGHSFANKHFW